MNETLHQRLK